MLLRSLLAALLVYAAPCHAVSDTDIKTVLAVQLEADFPDSPGKVALDPLPEFVRKADCKVLSARFRGDVSTHSGAGRIPVQIRCEQPRQWSAYISARIVASTRVLIACRSLPRNMPLQEADLCTSDRPSTSLRQHALFDPDEALGMSLKRPLNAGAVLYRTALTASVLIKRGESLVIEARRGNAVIAVRGTARQSGGYGEQISVRNTQSGRMLAAWILAPGRVSASAPPAPKKRSRDISQISAKVLARQADTPIENPVMAGHQTTYSE